MADESDWDEQHQRIVRHVQQTPPSCLSGFALSPSQPPPPWEDFVDWPLRCACGSDKGELLGYSLTTANPSYKGPLLYISPLAFRCSKCAQVTEVFDSDQHGYNPEIDRLAGETPKGTQYRGSGDRTAFPCPKCAATEFSVVARCLHSHFDLIEDEPELESRSQEFFDSFDVRGTCSHCGTTAGIANFETA